MLICHFHRYPKVLMHGEAKAMGSLKARLEQKYAGNEEGIKVHMPWNTETLNLTFRGDRIAKVCATGCVGLHLINNRPSAS